MPLKLTLKPLEKLFISGAQIVNGPSKSEITVLNHVPIVREKDMLSREEANTPAKQLYVTLLEMYTSPDTDAEDLDFYTLILQQLLSMNPDQVTMDLLAEISSHLREQEHYRALRVCKKLIQHEDESGLSALPDHLRRVDKEESTGDA